MARPKNQKFSREVASDAIRELREISDKIGVVVGRIQAAEREAARRGELDGGNLTLVVGAAVLRDGLATSLRSIFGEIKASTDRVLERDPNPEVTYPSVWSRERFATEDAGLVRTADREEARAAKNKPGKRSKK